MSYIKLMKLIMEIEMEVKEQLREALQLIVKQVVDKPEAVEIKSISSEHTTIYEIKCDTSDIGKVIGKSGSTVEALRHLAKIVGTKNSFRADLETVH